MHLFHRTDAAESIRSEGFRDGSGTYLTDHIFEGVWVSDTPLTLNEGAEGRYLITIDVSDFDLDSYEWQEKGKPYREFLIPAEVLNGFPIIAVEKDDWDQVLDWGSMPESLPSDSDPIEPMRLSRRDIRKLREPSQDE